MTCKNRKWRAVVTWTSSLRARSCCLQIRWFGLACYVSSERSGATADDGWCWWNDLRERLRFTAPASFHLSSRSLNWFVVSACMTMLGRWCQLGTMRLVKKLKRWSQFLLFSRMSLVCPSRVQTLAWLECQTTWSMSLDILKCCIRSPLTRRCSSVVNLSAEHRCT